METQSVGAVFQPRASFVFRACVQEDRAGAGAVALRNGAADYRSTPEHCRVATVLPPAEKGNQ
jgi:hypothetical protein